MPTMKFYEQALFYRFGGRPLTDTERAGLAEINFFEVVEHFESNIASGSEFNVENPDFQEFDNAVAAMSSEMARVLAADPLVATALRHIDLMTNYVWKDTIVADILDAIHDVGMCRTEEQWGDLAEHLCWCGKFDDLRDLVRSNPPAMMA